MPSVLFVNSGAPPVPAVHGGAIQSVIECLASALAYRGWNVGILTNATPMSIVAQSRLPSSIHWYHADHPLGGEGIRATWRKRRAILKRAGSIGIQYDNVVIHDIYSADVVRGIFPKSNIIWHVHNEIEHDKVLSWLVRHVNTIVCVSDYITRRIYQRTRFHSIRTVYNPLGSEWFQRNTRPLENGRRTVLFSGRIVPQKGLHVLVEALGRMPEHMKPKVRLVIAGALHFDGTNNEHEYARNVRRHLMSAGIEHTWLGYVSRSSMPEIYDSSEIVVAPSVGPDAAPLVAVEAQARRCAICAAEVGGLPEVVAEPWRDLLFPPGDSRELTRCLIHLLSMSSTEIRERSSLAYSQVSEKFSVEGAVAAWESILQF